MQMPVVTRDVGEQTEWATWHLCSPSQPWRGTLGTVPEPVWPSESSPQGWGWGMGGLLSTWGPQVWTESFILTLSETWH